MVIGFVRRSDYDRPGCSSKHPARFQIFDSSIGEKRLTHKNSPEPKPLLRLKTTTLFAIISLTLAVVFAALGFSKAGDSRVAPALVSTFLFISGICFAAQFVNGIRAQGRWQRVTAGIAAFLALFVVIMAIMFYQILTQVKMPTF
jgi:hypothetical protein